MGALVGGLAVGHFPWTYPLVPMLVSSHPYGFAGLPVRSWPRLQAVGVQMHLDATWVVLAAAAPLGPFGLPLVQFW